MKKIMVICVGLYISLTLFCVVTVTSGNENLLNIKVTEVVRTGVGSGPDKIGIITPSEANPEGPMSFALGEKGEIYILDQVNSRVQVFKGGKRIKTIPIPFKTFMDIDITPNGSIVLLDNILKKSVYILDSEGKTLNIIPLEGKLISYAPSVYEIMCVKVGKFPGIWVVVEDRSVRIAMLDGTPATERISLPGIFSWDGNRLMQAKIIGDATASVQFSKKDTVSLWDDPITIFLNRYIVHLLGLWDDHNGRTYLGAYLENGKPSNIIIVLNPEGKELVRVKLFVQKMPHEIHRSVRISPEGYIFQLALDKGAVFIRRYEILE